MASENLVNDLFEIVQSNEKEKLSYDDFEKDLLKSINLPNDEIDRALSIMLSQAQVNPNVIGESKGGTFVISPSFSASVISTIKYENQFIEGTKENELRKLNNLGNSLSEIIGSTYLNELMLNNFEALSIIEIEKLGKQYYLMDEEQRDKYKKGYASWLDKKVNDSKTDEERKFYSDAKSAEMMRQAKIEEAKKDESQRNDLRDIISNSKNFRAFFKEMKGRELEEDFELTDDIIAIWESYHYKNETELMSLEEFYLKLRELLADENYIGVRELCESMPEIAQKYKSMLERRLEESGQDIHTSNNDKLSDDEYLTQSKTKMVPYDITIKDNFPGVEGFLKKGDLTYDICVLATHKNIKDIQFEGLIDGDIKEYYDERKRLFLSPEAMKQMDTTEEETRENFGAQNDISADMGFGIDFFAVQSQSSFSFEERTVREIYSSTILENSMQTNNSGLQPKISQSEMDKYYLSKSEYMAVATDKKHVKEQIISEGEESFSEDNDSTYGTNKNGYRAQATAISIVGLVRKVESVKSSDVEEEVKTLKDIEERSSKKGIKEKESTVEDNDSIKTSGEELGE